MSNPTTKPPIQLELSDGTSWMAREVRSFGVAVENGDLRAASAHLDMIMVAARHVEAYLSGRLNGKAAP